MTNPVQYFIPWWNELISLIYFKAAQPWTRYSTIRGGSWRWNDVCLIGNISNFRLIHHQVRRRSFRKDEANNFLRETLCKAYDRYCLDNWQRSVSLLYRRDFRSRRISHSLATATCVNDTDNVARYRRIWSCLKAHIKIDLRRYLPSIILEQQRRLLWRSSAWEYYSKEHSKGHFEFAPIGTKLPVPQSVSRSHRRFCNSVFRKSGCH